MFRALLQFIIIEFWIIRENIIINIFHSSDLVQFHHQSASAVECMRAVVKMGRTLRVCVWKMSVLAPSPVLASIDSLSYTISIFTKGQTQKKNPLLSVLYWIGKKNLSLVSNQFSICPVIEFDQNCNVQHAVTSDKRKEVWIGEKLICPEEEE